MLGKLFKHEWRSFWKVPAAINIFLLVITVIGIISLVSPLWKLDYEIVGVLMVCAILFYYLAIFAGTIAVTVYIAVRYYKNVYTDEGYLTHTLPVAPRDVILSKMFIGAIWSLITGVVVCISIFSLLFVAFQTTNGDANFTEFYLVWKEIAAVFKRELGISMAAMGIFLVLYMIASTLFSILSLYSSISLGQLFTKHKVMGAVIFYIAEYTIFQFGYSLLLNVPLFTGIYSGFAEQHPGTLVNILMWGSLLVTIIIGIGLYFITEHMMKKKLNLD